MIHNIYINKYIKILLGSVHAPNTIQHDDDVVYIRVYIYIYILLLCILEAAVGRWCIAMMREEHQDKFVSMDGVINATHIHAAGRYGSTVETGGGHTDSNYLKGEAHAIPRQPEQREIKQGGCICLSILLFMCEFVCATAFLHEEFSYWVKSLFHLTCKKKKRDARSSMELAVRVVHIFIYTTSIHYARKDDWFRQKMTKKWTGGGGASARSIDVQIWKETTMIYFFIVWSFRCQHTINWEESREGVSSLYRRLEHRQTAGSPWPQLAVIAVTYRE